MRGECVCACWGTEATPGPPAHTSTVTCPECPQNARKIRGHAHRRGGGGWNEELRRLNSSLLLLVLKGNQMHRGRKKQSRERPRCVGTGGGRARGQPQRPPGEDASVNVCPRQRQHGIPQVRVRQRSASEIDSLEALQRRGEKRQSAGAGFQGRFRERD